MTRYKLMDGGREQTEQAWKAHVEVRKQLLRDRFGPLMGEAGYGR